VTNCSADPLLKLIDIYWLILQNTCVDRRAEDVHLVLFVLFVHTAHENCSEQRFSLLERCQCLKTNKRMKRATAGTPNQCTSSAELTIKKIRIIM